MDTSICARCGSPIDVEGERLTVTITIGQRDGREELARVRLCPRCAHEIEDQLTLETVYHESA